MKTIIFLMLLSAGILRAQDFGYEYAMLTDYRALGVSYYLQQFRPSPGNTLPDSSHIRFSTPMPMAEFRQSDSRLAIGYQTYEDRRGRSREAFSVYASTTSDLPLFPSARSKGNWFIPFMVSATYVRAQSPDAALEDFDVGSLGLGAGVKFKRFTRDLGIEATAAVSLGYASEGFSTDYGTETALTGEVTIILPYVILEGVLLGYRYEQQEWNMNNNGLDYRRQHHGAVIGILF
ncbi:MAG: hypothetical protein HUU02_10340 [Bacteroidetes bacterium]|nr:hypothetical protein [Bacteroidota bacterium]